MSRITAPENSYPIDGGNGAPPAWRVSVAPMMDWTDRHCRYFHRQLTHHSLLYTEMVTTGALLHGDVERHLNYHASEHPVALQLGGSEPDALAASARLAAEFGYAEVNLNCGCPSDRVKNGSFGACLMLEPERVRDCMTAMREAVDIPVTVKLRIGVDDQDDYAGLLNFVNTVAESGCTRFTVHARKAWLNGLSPKQNREIPPLKYEVVERLKNEKPNLDIVLNGGLIDWDSCDTALGWADGVMIGRMAYQQPHQLLAVDQRFFNAAKPALSHHEAVRQMLPYINEQLAAGVRLSAITRHMLGLFQACPGARLWRRYLSENAHRQGAGVEVVERALALLPDAEELAAISLSA